MSFGNPSKKSIYDNLQSNLWKITYLGLEDDKKLKKSQLMSQRELYIAVKILEEADLKRHLKKWARDYGIIERLVKLENLGPVYVLKS